MLDCFCLKKKKTSPVRVAQPLLYLNKVNVSIYLCEQNHRFKVYLTNSKMLQTIDEIVYVSSNAKVRVMCSFPLPDQFAVRLNLNRQGVPFPMKDLTWHRLAACGAEKTMHVEWHEAALLPVCTEVLPRGA